MGQIGDHLRTGRVEANEEVNPREGFRGRSRVQKESNAEPGASIVIVAVQAAAQEARRGHPKIAHEFPNSSMTRRQGDQPSRERAPFRSRSLGGDLANPLSISYSDLRVRPSPRGTPCAHRRVPPASSPRSHLLTGERSAVVQGVGVRVVSLSTTPPKMVSSSSTRIFSLSRSAAIS